MCITHQRRKRKGVSRLYIVCAQMPDVTIQYPEDMELSRDKSMADVQGDAMYPFVYLQLGSAYKAMLVGGEGGRQEERERERKCGSDVITC